MNKIRRFVVSEFVKTCDELLIDLGIQAFSQMLAYFSADGLTYHPQYVKVVNKEPLVSYKSQNITLSLAKRIGRFVKLELYFDNKWLLISEVNFKSQSTGKDMDFIDAAAAAAGTNSNASNHIKTENQQNSKQDRNDPAQVLSDTPEHHSGGSSQNGATLNTNAKSNLTAKETNQVSKLHTRYRLFCPFCTQFFYSPPVILYSPKFTKNHIENQWLSENETAFKVHLLLVMIYRIFPVPFIYYWLALRSGGWGIALKN